MIVEIGHFSLILALMVALVQAIIPMLGARRGDLSWMNVAPAAAIAQVLLISISFGALTYAFVVSDFTVVDVISNSHSDKPMLYKVTGVWGSHEGSMLLWVLILAIFGSAVALFGKNLPPTLRARTLSVQAMISVGFLLFILFTSNPFSRAWPPPPDGQGMNPLLQDPGLAFHPPFLYLGYVGFSIAFSFAIAALIEGRVDTAWARWVRPWTLVAWGFLTIGIGGGSWWAYYELGWGGWWFWDPVENASFMPWLAGTALLHSAIVVEKRNTMKAWTIFLAIITFALSLLGTFLVRSGVLTSVHAFAVDPRRGVFILVLLLVVVGGSLALFAIRGPSLKSVGMFRPVSREGGLLINNMLLTTAAAVVLLGTLYPLFLDAVGGGKISVGAPFFNAAFFPIMTPMVAVMAVGPLLAWKRSVLVGSLARLWAAFVAAAVAATIIWALFTDGPIIGPFGIGLATWLGVSSLIEFSGRIKLFSSPISESLGRLRRLPRSSIGMTLTHLGFAVVIAGITGASSWRVESIQVMKPGDKINVGGFDYVMNDVHQAKGPNYRSTVGDFTVSRNGKLITVLHPEKRLYNVRNIPTTEAAIHTTFFGDLYAVIGDPQGNSGGYVTRIYFNPLVAWMWVGGLMMVLGGVVSLTDRRYRVGAPKNRRPISTVVA